ncbi:MAG: helix-turn-helix transcriptional regulator [Desulfitobacterium hafniense]
MKDRLRNLRMEKGFTQIKMQQLTGIDQSDYSKIEAGKRYYTVYQCKRIALALGTSTDYLLGMTNEKAPYPRAK